MSDQSGRLLGRLRNDSNFFIFSGVGGFLIMGGKPSLELAGGGGGGGGPGARDGITGAGGGGGGAGREGGFGGGGGVGAGAGVTGT